MNKRERVLRTLRREEIDYLPSQITFADRTRDAVIHESLGLSEDVTLDDYLENHIVITLTKADYPLFFRNDTALMRELETDGYAKVDEENGVVYDSWGMGIKVGEDGFFCCFHPLQDQQTEEFAAKWMPERIFDAVTSPTLEERVRKWTPPPCDMPGNFDWMKRDIEEHGKESFILPSGYFGIYERAYGMTSIPTLLENMALNPSLVGELFDKITDYKSDIARRMVEFDIDVGHMGDDLGMQHTTFFSPETFRTLLLPCYNRLWGIYKDAGKLMSMHSCGCVEKFLPELVEAGLDLLEPVQPCNNLERIKKDFGDRLTFWGGIDTQELLPYGTPDDIRRDAAQVIRTLGKGGGHIIGPSQEIMNDVPLENIIALIETIKEERASAM